MDLNSQLDFLVARPSHNFAAIDKVFILVRKFIWNVQSSPNMLFAVRKYE